MASVDLEISDEYVLLPEAFPKKRRKRSWLWRHTLPAVLFLLWLFYCLLFGLGSLFTKVASWLEQR